MKVQQFICREWRPNDTSVIYMLLLMVLTVLGCNSRDGGESGKKDTDDTSSSGDTGVAQAPSRQEASKKPLQHTGNRVSGKNTRHAPEENFVTKIFNHDRTHHFSVFLSLIPGRTKRFYFRELMVNPYFDELFACARVHKRKKDPFLYQVHFTVSDGRRILFDKLTAGKTDTASKEMSRNDSKVAGCLLGLYRNSVVELSGSVPVSHFSLSFDFKQ